MFRFAGRKILQRLFMTYGVDDTIIFVFDFQKKKTLCKNFLVRPATKIIESFHLQLTIKSNQVTTRIIYQHFSGLRSIKLTICIIITAMINARSLGSVLLN